MHNFLFICENFSYGGMETQISDQVEFLKKMGDNCYLCTGRFVSSFCSSNFSKIFSGFDLSLEEDKLYKNVLDLLGIIREYKIDFIHVHPFRSILPGRIAAAVSARPSVVTLHGPLSLTYLNEIELNALKNTSLISVSQEVHDITLSKLNCESLILPNTVNVGVRKGSYYRGKEDKVNALLVSRLDRDKVNGIKNFLSKLADYEKENLSEICSVQIAGDGESRIDLERFVRGLNLKNKPIFLGHVENVYEIMKQYDLIVGMGRVILEAMSQGLECFSINYDGPVGLVDSFLLQSLSYANFSGRNLGTSGEFNLQTLINQHSRDEDDWKKIYEFLTSNYNYNSTWEKYYSFVQDVRPVPDSDRGFIHEYIRMSLRHK